MSAFPKRSFVAAFVLAAIFSESQGAQFKFGARTLTVPDGFEIEMVAGPPLIERPVSADFDEEGRLYVTDSSGSNEKLDVQLEEKPHRIVRLEDTAGNGKFDKSTVFADKVMFPEGAMWKDGSFYIAAPPSIWKFTETASGLKREEWFQGKTLTGCGNDLHGPYAGPDGWIYWCKGAFAKQIYERPGKPPFVTRAAHIFRSRSDGSDIEPVMTGGMDNPVGVAFTETGERILCGTFFQNPANGKRDGLIHAIYGGVYGKIHDVIDEHPRSGEVLPIMSHFGPAAPCCVIRYRSEIFGREYRNNLFTCCFNLHKIIRSVLIPDGATFKTTDTDFLTSDDPDFHPTAVLEDADGSLIVLNTGGWYKICCPTSQLAKPDVLGEIYRIRRRDAPKVDDPRGLRFNWASLSAKELVQYLADARPCVRDRAIDQLAKKGNASISALARVLKQNASTEARRNALWALTQIDAPSARKSVRGALADKDNTVRHVAALSCALWRDKAALNALVRLLDDSDPQVQRSAAEALGRIGESKAIAPILGAATKLNDASRALEHSLIYALIEIADHDTTAKFAHVKNPHARRVALIALDQMAGGRVDASLVVPLLVSQDAILKRTANWIISRHHDWGGAMAGFLAERLGGTKFDPSETATLESQLASFTRDPTIQQLMTRTLASGSKPARVVVLHAIADADVKPTPVAWADQVMSMLETQDMELLRAVIASSKGMSPPKKKGDELNAALRRIGSNPDLGSALRLQALAAAGLEELPPELFEFITKNVDASKPWAMRSIAAGILARVHLDRAQLLELAAVMRVVGPMELSKLLNAFDRTTDDAVRSALVENLISAKSVHSLRADQLQPKFAKFSGPVRERAEELLKMLNADAAKQKERLDQIEAQLPPGDVRRGQAIFNSPKVACSSCHAIGYLGGHVGPDLTTIGTIRTQRDLLESIVYPSASFVRSFEPMVVVTKGGDDYTGILRKDAADEVVLVSGPQTEVRIPRANIVEMHQGTVSIMPQGFDEQMSRQELADLLAFLKNTRWGPK